MHGNQQFDYLQGFSDGWREQRECVQVLVKNRGELDCVQTFSVAWGLTTSLRAEI